VVVPVGARDVILRPLHGGSIRGSIVGHEPFNGIGARSRKESVFWIACTGSAGSRIGPWIPTNGGVFAIDPLPPGVYSVSVGAHGESLAPLLRFDGVVVASGPPTLDPRLQSIDVSALLRRVRVHPVDDAQKPILEGAFDVLRGGERVHHGEFGRSAIDVVVCTEPIDLVIDAPGFETLLVRDVVDGQKVELRRGRLMRLKLGSRDLVESLAELCVIVRMVPVGEPAGREEMSSGLDQGGETSFTNLATGTWRVELELASEIDAPGPRARVRRAREQIVTIGAQRLVEVRIDVSEDEIGIARALLPD
jgi:hypothetical protein